MSENNDIKVTVYLSTYNQEEYVAQALDSIVMQRTTFPIEVIVADDCSTDRTQEIINQYKDKYPNLIRTYYPEKNLGGCRKLTNCIDMGLFRGEYLAYLEGDDYWLNENRLQILVDFLDNHKEYSRVSHKRLVIDDNGKEKGFDISASVLNKPFYIEDFLNGKQYSDFGSVFRNYFKEVENKYHPLLLASRNVCDFQDMFITQDFGPVFVMDKCLGVYRSRSIAGATNYNSITTQNARCKENIHLAEAVEEFYKGKYDLTPMIRHNQKRLLSEAIKSKEKFLFEEVREFIGTESFKELIPEQLYLARRGKRKEEVAFINACLSDEERSGLALSYIKYWVYRVITKINGKRIDEKVRGTINVKTND